MIFSGNTYQSIYTQTGKFIFDLNFNIFSQEDVKIVLAEGENFSGKDISFNLIKGKIFDPLDNFIGSYQIGSDHHLSILSDGGKYDIYLDGKETVFNTINSGYYYNYVGIETSGSGEFHFNFSGEKPSIIFNNVDNIMDNNGILNVPFWLSPIVENRFLKIFDIDLGNENNMTGIYFTNIVDSSGIISLIGNSEMSGNFYQSISLNTDAGLIETGFNYIRSVEKGGSYLDLVPYDSQTDFYLFGEVSGYQIYAAIMDSAIEYPTFDFRLESNQYGNSSLPSNSGAYIFRIINATGNGSGEFSGFLTSGSGELSGLWKGNLYYSGNPFSIYNKYYEFPLTYTVSNIFSGVDEVSNVMLQGIAEFNVYESGIDKTKKIISNRRYSGPIISDAMEFPFLMSGEYTGLFTGQEIPDWDGYTYNPSKIWPIENFIFKYGFNPTGVWTGTITEDNIVDIRGLNLYHVIFPVSGKASFNGRASSQTGIFDFTNSSGSYDGDYMAIESFPYSFSINLNYIQHQIDNIVKMSDSSNLLVLSNELDYLVGIDDENPIWSGLVYQNNVEYINYTTGNYSTIISNIFYSKKDAFPIYEAIPISNISSDDNFLFGYVDASGIGNGEANGYLTNGSGWISGSNGSGYISYDINGFQNNIFAEECEISGYITSINDFSGYTGSTGIIYTSTGIFSGSAYGYANFVGNFTGGLIMTPPPILDQGSNFIYIELDTEGPRASGNGLIDFAYQTKLTGFSNGGFPQTTKCLAVSYSPPGGSPTNNSLFNYIDPEPPAYYRETIDINGTLVYTEFEWQAPIFQSIKDILNPIISGMNFSGINKKWLYSGLNNNIALQVLELVSQLYPPYASSNNPKGTAIVNDLPARVDNVVSKDPGVDLNFLDYLPLNKTILSSQLASGAQYNLASGVFPNRYVKAVPQLLTQRIYDLNGNTGFFTGIINTNIPFFEVAGEAFGKWNNSLYAYYKPFPDFSGIVNLNIDFGTGKWLTGYFQYDAERYERQKGYPWFYDEETNIAHPSWHDITINATEYFSTTPWDGKSILANNEVTQSYSIPIVTNQPSSNNHNFRVTLDRTNYRIISSDFNYNSGETPQDNITYFSYYLTNANISKNLYAKTGYKNFFDVWDLQTGYDLDNFSQNFSELGWSGYSGYTKYYSDNEFYNNTGDIAGQKILYAKIIYKNESPGTSDTARLIFTNGLNSGYLDIYGKREAE